MVGVDIKPQPHYCGDEFYKADALEFPLDGYDAIHASPPCQGYSRLRHLPWLKDKKYPMLIDAMRKILKATNSIFVIENVEDSPLDGITLCGQMFDLPVYRHRKFESNILIFQPFHNRHLIVIGEGRMLNDRRKGSLNNPSSKGSWGNQQVFTVAGGQFRKKDGEKALGIDWMSCRELSQAIPPAYTEWIGKQLIKVLEHKEAPCVS